MKKFTKLWESTEFKTKEILDTMSYDEIRDLRTNILSQTTYNEEDKQYTDELEFYTDVRFKDKALEMQQRWKESKDDLSAKATSLIYKVGGDDEGVYDFRLAGSLNQIGEFKYIQGIEINNKIRKISGVLKSMSK